jgi:predicted enzyme related to lactoylglutathione lyase
MIGSDQVEALKSWYKAAFSPEVNETGAFVFGNVGVFIESHSKVSGPNENGHRILINLDVTDCRALEAHLKAQDVNWLRPVEQEPFGLIGTVADPDGNLIQIIQWGATPAEGHQ